MNSRRGRAGLSLVVVTVLVGLLSAMASSDASRASASADLLPDLDQELPSALAIRTAVEARPPYLFEIRSATRHHSTGHPIVGGARSIYVLGFRSAVRNIGVGPLIIEGDRPDEQTQSMTVDQIVTRAGQPSRLVSEVGVMRFIRSPDHNHWHYLQFDRYELRSAATGEPVVTDRKSGFCLGDRYAVEEALPASPSQPVYTSRCGLDQPELLRMNEGISVGYGDDYAAFLEGQDLPLSDLPEGRYVLVHRANSDRRIKELSYDNNAASLLLELRWVHDAPVVTVLAACPDTDRCTEDSTA